MMQYGYLFRWRGRFENQPGENQDTPLSLALKQIRQFKDVTGRQGLKVPVKVPDNWKVVNFQSSELLGDDENVSKIDGYYEYKLLLRESTDHGTVVFAAKRYKITDAAVRTFNAYVSPKLQRRHIKVAELADRMISKSSKLDYYLTHLTADVPRFGASLRSITLAGEDLASAGFFDASAEKNTQSNALKGFPYSYFTARQIGLRSPGSTVSEFGKFGGTGTLQFPDEGVQDLEAFLSIVGV